MLKDRLNRFYVLAFAPLLLIQYSGHVRYGGFFPQLIPLYAFLLLLIKKDKLSVFMEANRVYQIVGLTVMLASFFVYYAVVFFYPAQFYGGANYAVYLIGLFLLFFEASALKESFSILFLIVGALSSGFVGDWMEFYLEPAVPYFVQIMGFVLGILGIPAELGNPTTFAIRMPSGKVIYLGVAAGCIGIYSFLTFAIIIVITMIEDPSSLRTKLLWSVAGIIGTFFVNIIRVSLIFVVIYYFGFEDWGKIHTPIGYVLFIVWLAIFFLIFSKRKTIISKLQSLFRKLR
jgi:exosortase/archaeosortase family protein